MKGFVLLAYKFMLLLAILYKFGLLFCKTHKSELFVVNKLSLFVIMSQRFGLFVAIGIIALLKASPDRFSYTYSPYILHILWLLNSIYEFQYYI